VALEGSKQCFEHTTEMCERAKVEVKAEDREGFDTGQAEFEVWVAADIE